MKGASFAKGLGEWIGAAEVYDHEGRFAGMGHDKRTVKADDKNGSVTVAVRFDGPFTLAGEYTIVDRGHYRLYQGPLNLGYAEALSEGLVAAHNYWPTLGLSQRFCLFVLADGSTQLSLALLSRGEQLHWTVVGEYQRQVDVDSLVPVGVPLLDPAAVGDDPNGGRSEALLLRDGRWKGELQHCDSNLLPTLTTEYVENVSVTNANDGNKLEANTQLSGLGLAPDVEFEFTVERTSLWSGADALCGSAMLSGGRALSGHFHHRATGLRLWRREVTCVDGTKKAVLFVWYRGDNRLGASYGILDFQSKETGTN